jgi:hypothetical protein
MEWELAKDKKDEIEVLENITSGEYHSEAAGESIATYITSLLRLPRWFLQKAMSRHHRVNGRN